jgi:hypothetical protein
MQQSLYLVLSASPLTMNQLQVFLVTSGHKAFRLCPSFIQDTPNSLNNDVIRVSREVAIYNKKRFMYSMASSELYAIWRRASEFEVLWTKSSAKRGALELDLLRFWTD